MDNSLSFAYHMYDMCALLLTDPIRNAAENKNCDHLVVGYEFYLLAETDGKPALNIIHLCFCFC